MNNRRYLFMGLGAVALLGIGAVVALLVTGALDPDGSEQATAAVASPATSPGPQMTSYVDSGAGIALEYPADWDAIESSDPQVRLIATPNRRDSMLLRVVELNDTVTAEELPALREFTRDLVLDGTNVDLLAGPEQVEVAGLPGWFYLYRFDDDASGDRGAHSHYFLFEGDRMIVLVFQALPASGFEELAPVFDRIMSTLRTVG